MGPVKVLRCGSPFCRLCTRLSHFPPTLPSQPYPSTSSGGKRLAGREPEKHGLVAGRQPEGHDLAGHAAAVELHGRARVRWPWCEAGWWSGHGAAEKKSGKDHPYQMWCGLFDMWTILSF